MVWGKKQVHVIELKRLLHDLHDKQPYTGIRFRFLGEMWQRVFLQILKVEEEQGLFFDETAGQLLSISDFSKVVQFEIDYNFQQYAAHFHYDVVLDSKRHSIDLT
jgi:hypothetical protein